MKQKGISVLTGGAYKLFGGLISCGFPPCFADSASPISLIAFQLLIYWGLSCRKSDMSTAFAFLKNSSILLALGIESMYLRASALFSASCMLRPSWFRTFTKVSCRLGKIIVPPCPVLQLRVVKPQREVYWVVGYEDGKLVARQL